MVGTFSMQKGAYDFVEIASRLAGSMKFRFVGVVLEEALALRRRAEAAIEFVPRVPEFELGHQYSWGDVFVFPTIQDGFAAVLAQALAAGLPVLATPNSSGPDIVRQGYTGWILPIRSPSSFVEQLRWCDKHRGRLATMALNCCSGVAQRDWQDMASDLESIYAEGER